MALVEKLDSQNNSVDVLFMKKTHVSGFIFAEEEERDTVALDNITRVLPDPTVIGGSARCSAIRKIDIDLDTLGRVETDFMASVVYQLLTC